MKAIALPFLVSILFTSTVMCQINTSNKNMELIQVFFDGDFDKKSKYLVLNNSDTICIYVASEQFTTQFYIPIEDDLVTGDTLSLVFYQRYKKRRKCELYFDTGLKVRYIKGRTLLYVTSGGLVSTQEYAGWTDYLSYIWF